MQFHCPCGRWEETEAQGAHPTSASSLGSFCFSASEESSSLWPSSAWMEHSILYPFYLRVAMHFLKGVSRGAKPKAGQVWDGLSGGGIRFWEERL